MAIMDPISQLAALLRPQQRTALQRPGVPGLIGGARFGGQQRGERPERPQVGGGNLRMLASILSGGLGVPMAIGSLVRRNERGERFDNDRGGFRDIGGGLRGRAASGPRGDHRGFQVE